MSHSRWQRGTRDGKIGPFKKGVFLLAMKAKVPIIPVAAEGILTDGEDDREAVIKRVRDTMIDMNRDVGGPGGDKDNAIAEAKAAA